MGDKYIRFEKQYIPGFTNGDTRAQQIRLQIRDLVTRTKITIKRLNSEGGIFER